MFKNSAGQKLIVFAFDSTTNLPKVADAANLTAYVSKDYGAVTVLGDTSATEMDATNAKGYYLFDLAQTESNADTLLFSAKSSTANIVVIGVPATVFTVPANFTAQSIDSNGRVDIIKIAGTTQTARDLGASVLLSSGTGAGQISLSAGLVTLAGVTHTGAVIPTVTTLTNLPAITTDWLTSAGVSAGAVTKIQAGLSTYAGGAVASVTGNVGGNVVGSVGSVATGGITAASFAAGAIDATAIATDAIGSAEISAAAVTKIQAGLATPTNITAGTITTATNVTTVNGLAAGVITATSIAADAITAAKIADGAIDSATFASGTTIPRVTLADTLTTYTGNTPQTGDAFARLGAAGAGLTAIGDARLGNLDVAVSTRLATAGYTAPDNAGISTISTGVASLLARLGAFTGSGVNTVLGFLRAIFRSDATLPSDVGGTFDPTTDALEAIRNRGDAAWGAGAVPSVPQIAAGVWDLATSGHTTAGTFGAAMAAAGNASDPWSGVAVNGKTYGQIMIGMGAVMLGNVTENAPHNVTTFRDVNDPDPGTTRVTSTNTATGRTVTLH